MRSTKWLTRTERWGQGAPCQLRHKGQVIWTLKKNETHIEGEVTWTWSLHVKGMLCAKAKRSEILEKQVEVDFGGTIIEGNS